MYRLEWLDVDMKKFKVSFLILLDSKISCKFLHAQFITVT